MEAHAHQLLATATAHGFVLMIVDALELLAELADPAPAAVIFGATTAHRARIGYVARTVPDPVTLDATVSRLRNDQVDAFTRGTSLALDEAVELVQRSRGKRGRPVARMASLTPTEARVVELVADGLSNEAIAGQLLMSRATVKTHLTHIYAKTGTTNRTELAARWHSR